MQNSLFTLLIERKGAAWVFTDHGRGLVDEPFVSGMPEIISEYLIRKAMAKGLLTPYTSAQAYFSDKPFPGADLILVGGDRVLDGRWYSTDSPTVAHQEESLHGWLCPATLAFFPDFPDELYVSLVGLSNGTALGQRTSLQYVSPLPSQKT